MRKLEVVGMELMRQMFPEISKGYTGPKIQVDEYVAQIFSGENHGIKRCSDEANRPS